ncbi:MAG: hypothetical protein C4528_00895 [Gammaproteobacteria bacterium]|nr:MAG: hypothetical protein C4528_00895 [Gammaproteobacteria bacterium]
MSKTINPSVLGVSLALTFGVLYSICAAAFALWPETAFAFFNAWFHGMDLRLLQPEGGRAVTLNGYFYGLIGILITAYVAGVVFALLYNWLNGVMGGKGK